MLSVDFKIRPIAAELMSHEFFADIHYKSKRYTEATGYVKDEL